MKNKITSIALSVVIAFGLWLYVVTNISQETENTFHNIPIVWEGDAWMLISDKRSALKTEEDC